MTLTEGNPPKPPTRTDAPRPDSPRNGSEGTSTPANAITRAPLSSLAFSPVLKIVVIYALAGAAWILLSDKFVLSLARDPDVVSRLQTYKGWFFVAVTAVLLGCLMQRYLSQIRRSEIRLFESQNRLAGIIGSAMDGIITVDDQFRVILLNPAAEKMFGCRAVDVLGHPLDGFIPERYRSKHAEDIQLFGQANVTRRKMGELGSVFGLRADGTEFPIEASISHVEVASRRLFTVILRDITQRKQAEEALRESEERLRLALEAADQGLYDLNIHTGEAKVSPEYATMLGYDPTTFRETNACWIERLHPDDREHIADTYHAYIRGDIPTYAVEFRQLTQSGDWKWILSLGKIVARDSDGRPLRMLGTHTDITERKYAEQALRLSEARLLAALNAGSMGTWIWDVPKDRMWWDDAALKIWDRTRDEVAEGHLETILSFIHADDRQRLQHGLVNFLGSSSLEHAQEYRIALPDGNVRWLSSRGRLERDADGRPLRMVGVCLDITDNKREEEFLLRSQKLEALGTLAGGIAHDFNNILLAISGNTELATEDLPPGHPAMESLVEIHKASARAADLVDRILSFSKPQDHKREVLNLQPVVEEALKLLRATIPAMIEIRTDFASDLPKISADSTQIHQIIVNLATNAAYAIGPAGGQIQVQLDAADVTAELAVASHGLREGRYTRLSVIDNGCGIEQSILERIFDPFFTTKPHGEGTGLGLSVVHGIMKSLNGGVTVYSRPGEGSTFRLYFPAVESEIDTAQPEARAASTGQGQHVLYIDDEEALVLLAIRLLTRLGYQVTGHTDVLGALQEFQTRPQEFDAVITDIAMPGMSGFELASKLLATRPDVPILMTSGYIGVDDQKAAVEMGARELIPKPHTLEQLGHALDRVFRDKK